MIVTLTWDKIRIIPEEWDGEIFEMVERDVIREISFNVTYPNRDSFCEKITYPSNSYFGSVDEGEEPYYKDEYSARELFPEFVERVGRKFNIPENEWYSFDLEIQDGFNRKLETLQI